MPFQTAVPSRHLAAHCILVGEQLEKFPVQAQMDLVVINYPAKQSFSIPPGVDNFSRIYCPALHIRPFEKLMPGIVSLKLQFTRSKSSD